MDNIKISVIVPVYNIENYIVKTVNSICNQTYNNLEIILVDDGSTDKTPDILNDLAMKDKRIKVIHKENGGVTKARITGVKCATGEWIGFVDGDDYIESNMYEILLDNAIKYNAMISHCGYQMIFPSRVDYYYGSGKVIVQDNKSGIKDLLSGDFIEPGLCNKLFHRNLLEKFLEEDKMDFTIKNMEDLLMNFYLFEKSEKSVFLDECLYHYILRKDSASTSTVNENKLKDPLKVLYTLEKEVILIPEYQFIIRTRILAKLINISTLRETANEKLIRPYRNYARKELCKMMPHVLKEQYSRKQKMQAIWVAVWPASYRWIHFIYEKITRIDKKYEVS